MPDLFACAVTGKMVPEDELVDFQGQRVCAEGKAILLDRLRAGESLVGEKEPPGFWVRFGCYFLDALILNVPTQLIRFFLVGNTPRPTTGQLVFLLIAQSVYILYYGQLQAFGGQSPGKRVGHLMVVNRDGSPMSAATSYIRALAYLGPGLVTSLGGLLGGTIGYGVGLAVVGVWGLTDCVCLVFDRDQQRSLHDRIAGTRVVVKE